MRKTWDKVNSTYWWKMYLLPQFDQRRNASPDNPMVGYSQSEGWAECQDKHQLLKNKIINPHIKCDWINKCSRIEIYKRTSFYISTATDQLIVQLESKDFVVYTQAYGKQSGDLIYWLKQLYNEILQGTHKEYILSPAPKKVNYSVSLDDKLNPDKYNSLRSNSDLQVLCTKLKAEGFAESQVLHFYRKMTEKIERSKY